METAAEMSTKFGKLAKFDGVDFRRWQKKMHFLLSSLNVVYVLSTPCPEPVPIANNNAGNDDAPANDNDNDAVMADPPREMLKWINDDYICSGHILNAMTDSLFDIYQYVESAKELWEELEAKYMAEDSSSKKFLVSDFNNYRMVDSRPVMEQYNELVRILGQFRLHNINVDESFSVSSIIDKLPPSWKEFKHSLKHRKEDFTIVELGSHLRIEESLRSHERNGKSGNVTGSSVNMVEEK